MGPPGQVATLILPADASWTEVSDDPSDRNRTRPSVGAPVDVDRVEAAAAVLRSGEPTALFVGGRVVRGQALRDAAAISAASGARLLCETFPARLERGAGVPPVERLGYLAEFAAAQLGRVGAPHPGRRRLTGVVLRLPGQGQRPGARRMHGARPGRPRRRRRRHLGGPARRLGCASPVSVGPGRQPAAVAHRGPHRRVVVRRTRAPCCPKGPSCPTRATPAGCSRPGPPPGRRPTTGCA